MLALAHDLQAKLDRGEHPDQATLAAQLGFTRGRLSKLLDLTLLAPDIQEEILHPEAVDGVEPLAERDLHQIARQPAWADQREVWSTIRPAASGIICSHRLLSALEGFHRPCYHPVRSHSFTAASAFVCPVAA